MALQPAGNVAYIANFAGNNVTLLSVNKGNGQLTVPTNTNPIPQLNPPNFFNTGTGPIAIAPSAAKPFLYVANQGSGDISAFTIDPGTGNLGLINGSPFVIGASFHPTSIAVSAKGDPVCEVTMGDGRNCSRERADRPHQVVDQGVY